MASSRKRQACGVEWSARAVRDLEAIGDDIALDNSRAAMDAVVKLAA